MVEEPEPLPGWLLPDAEAYDFCGRSRGPSGYIGPESVLAYCDLLGIEALDERQRLLRLLLTVDARVVAHHREKARGEGDRGKDTQARQAAAIPGRGAAPGIGARAGPFRHG